MKVQIYLPVPSKLTPEVFSTDCGNKCCRTCLNTLRKTWKSG